MQRIGVQLAADGAAEYLATLKSGADAEQAIGAAATDAVRGVNALDDGAQRASKGVIEFGKDGNITVRMLDGLEGASGDAAKDALGLGEDASKAAGGIDGLGDAADRAGKESTSLGDDAEKGGEGLSFLEHAAVGAARKLGELAVEGAQAAAQAIVDFAKDGIKAAGDFEGGMNTFAATVGGELDTSGLHLDDFKQLFISLGRDLPVSTAEVQQAAIEMSKGGIDPATIAAGGLKQALQFAAASGLGLADAAQISAKILQGWTPLAASAADKTAFFASSTDLLTKATTAAATNVDQLSLGLFNVQGTAQSAGVSFNDTVTTLALLTPSFNSSATAGDSMKNMISRLIPQTDTAAKAMADLGLLTQDGTSAFYDANGAFLGMRHAAGLLDKAFDGLSDAQRAERLQTIFGNDAKNAANVLIKAGIKGYDDITKKIALQNGVAEQAAKKQQGFNVATDNLMGSLEALQITIFSAALPALTKIVGLLAGGINVVTDYAAATLEGKTALSGIASFIGATAVPALVGLTAATTAYAVASGLAAIGGVQNLGLALVLVGQRAILAAGSLTAAAGAAALAALPFIAIGAAVAVTALKFQEFNAKVAGATQQLLNSKPFWTDGTTALENYGAASEATQQKLAPVANALRGQRDLLEQQVESLGRRAAAGLVTDEQYQKEFESLNAQANALQIASHQLDDMVGAELKAQAASLTATAALDTMRGGTEELGGQVHLTADEMEKFIKKIEDIKEKGGAALQGYATTQSEFLGGVEQRQADHAATIADLEAKKQKATTDEQKQGIDDQIRQANDSYHDQEQAAAASYVRQQKEQQQHLGQMLIDYTVAQAQLGNISKDKAAIITSALEKEYGLQKSSVASTFLEMAGSIDKFAHSSNQDVSSLTKTLHDQQGQAADTQRAMDGYAKTYTATAVNNFIDAKGDADDYIESLETVPTRVQSTMELPSIDERDREMRTIRDHINDIPNTKSVIINVEYRERGAPTSGRATGGPMTAMQPYLVGERGPEMIIPDRDSYVLNASETRRAMASPPMGGSNSSYSRVTNLSVTIQGNGVTYGDVVAGVRAGLQAEGQDADVRIRTGVQ